MPFQFLDPGRLIDSELELVAPGLCWSEELLQSVANPMCRDDPAAAIVDRKWVEEYLKNAPGGRSPGNERHGRVPAYHFWMRLDPRSNSPIRIAGQIGLRVGNTPDLEMYYGHIGYNVYPPARRRRYAERGCRLLFPLARAHRMSTLWITCNPENIASRKTCERLGAEFVEIVDVPPTNSLFARGERHKCRYRIDLSV